MAGPPGATWVSGRGGPWPSGCCRRYTRGRVLQIPRPSVRRGSRRRNGDWLRVFEVPVPVSTGTAEAVGRGPLGTSPGKGTGTSKTRSQSPFPRLSPAHTRTEAERIEMWPDAEETRALLDRVGRDGGAAEERERRWERHRAPVP